MGGFVAGTGSAVNSETHNYIFENCYSTAMVGMQNAASAQGGFIGQIESPTTNASYINCFSAGEVGTLTTTTEGFNNIIGGFIGQKSNVNAEFNRCYYDKQTSAMRERAVGTVNTTFDGITGLTTKPSPKLTALPARRTSLLPRPTRRRQSPRPLCGITPRQKIR